MEALHPHCAGLDVQKARVVAYVRHTVEGKIEREMRSFRMTTQDHIAYTQWLSAEGCTLTPEDARQWLLRTDPSIYVEPASIVRICRPTTSTYCSSRHSVLMMIPSDARPPRARPANASASAFLHDQDP